jgi:dihydrofolate synthase/folylpolyglutamate synthase
MNHKKTLEYLDQKGNEVQMMHLGLHRTIAMMQILGDPHTKYPSIHIAGTNGKGSVAAMSESMLRHSGLKTGLYTSPHLVRVEERIRINGCPVSPRSFSILATRIRNAEELLLKKNAIDRPLTTFEFLTSCAFLHFAQQKVDVAVIEVGLGGKLDATNVVHPMVSVITGVSLDHQNYLGRTIGKIAGEKAGIIKEGIPVISGCGDLIVQRIVRNRAKSVKAPLLELRQDFSIRNQREKGGRYRFDLRTPNCIYKNLNPSLAGAYQTQNAALAVMAMQTQKSFRIKIGDIRKGLKNTHWEGRLDEYRAVRRTLLDGAHNPEAAQLLRKFLLQRKESEIHLVFGAVRDKNIQKIGEALFPLATRIHLTPLVNTRSSNPVDVAQMHKKYRARMVIHLDMREALASAWKECPSSGLVVITGSLYLVGELLPVVQAHSKTRKSGK